MTQATDALPPSCYSQNRNYEAAVRPDEGSHENEEAQSPEKAEEAQQDRNPGPARTDPPRPLLNADAPERCQDIFASGRARVGSHESEAHKSYQEGQEDRQDHAGGVARSNASRPALVRPRYRFSSEKSRAAPLSSAAGGRFLSFRGAAPSAGPRNPLFEHLSWSSRGARISSFEFRLFTAIAGGPSAARARRWGNWTLSGTFVIC